MIGLNTGERIKEDRWWPSKEAFALTLATRLGLDQVVLADAAYGSRGLAHNNITQPDIVALVRSSDATAYADQEANTDRWQRGKKARGRGRSRGDAVVSGGQSGNNDIVLSHTTPCINVCISLVSSEAGWNYMSFIEHRFCSGPFDGESSDPGDRIGVGAVEGVEGYHNAEVNTLKLSGGERRRARNCRKLLITVSQRAQRCQLLYSPGLALSPANQRVHIVEYYMNNKEIPSDFKYLDYIVHSKLNKY